jgi:hypothetical protein
MLLAIFAPRPFLRTRINGSRLYLVESFLYSLVPPATLSSPAWLAATLPPTEHGRRSERAVRRRLCRSSISFPLFTIVLRRLMRCPPLSQIPGCSLGGSSSGTFIFELHQQSIRTYISMFSFRFPYPSPAIRLTKRRFILTVLRLIRSTGKSSLASSVSTSAPLRAVFRILFLDLSSVFCRTLASTSVIFVFIARYLVPLSSTPRICMTCFGIYSLRLTVFIRFESASS